MKQIHLFFILIMMISGCYSIPEINGFDVEKWSKAITDCEETKVEQAELIIANEELLFGEGQAEIKALLGQPDENELYRRNQKFFYYDLTLNSDTCEVLFQRLSIRFDALDRVKEVMIIEG